jgi:hypothetical protein
MAMIARESVALRRRVNVLSDATAVLDAEAEIIRPIRNAVRD